MRHFLRFKDFSREEHLHLFERAKVLKDRFKRYIPYQPLTDRMLAMVFEKSSTRTRVSFEAGIYQLGGQAIFLDSQSTQLGRAEPIEDTARVITRMVDLVMIRTFEQARVERFAEFSRVPVINGLTNEFHPCQVLADIFTFVEQRGPIAGKTVAWIGDANNMSYTWLEAARVLDFRLHVATPAGYAMQGREGEPLDTEHLSQFTDPRAAAAGAHLVTTDVWTSMGYEAEAQARQAAFEGFIVDRAVMAAAAKDALFMHCLPAHRGEEVSAEVIDGAQSVVWEEAENRLHVQKALMEYLLLGKISA
ncbi:MAG TPA: ornithine carbamoyltransferase [Usitatibacteraceae bacterium]|nr:ornithine carbamoyltransferase [Usitatibacteraceae bacterium]